MVRLLSALLIAAPAIAWAQTLSLPAARTPSPPSAPVQPPPGAAHGAGKPTAHTKVVSPRGPAHPQKPPVQPPAAAAPPLPQDKPADDAAEVKPADNAAEPSDGTQPKLPRFASLRSDDVNMRVGPGTRYRIDWVYKRRDLPVEIEREYDVWRWVRDPDGIHGWVHQATLMGRRSFIVQGADATLRAEPADTAGAVAILRVGVIGRIRSCEAASDWCNVQSGSYRGFLRREQFWGLLPSETVTP
jgi:SH3-like domain-containing protein